MGTFTSLYCVYIFFMKVYVTCKWLDNYDEHIFSHINGRIIRRNMLLTNYPHDGIS